MLGAARSGPLLALDEPAVEFFEKQVRPILVARCYECHSGTTAKPKGGLRLDSRAAALKGGDTGPAIIPSKPMESLLVDAINYGELYQMPPKSKLAAEEIAALTKWVEQGAPWPDERGQGPGARGQESAGFDLAKRKAEHWCWQPIVAPKLPPLRAPRSALRTPIDAFIQARLEEKGLSPAPPADERTLIRRAYFDLIGLPPAVEELEALTASVPLSPNPLVPFSNAPDTETRRQGDRERDEFAVVIDRLLASPHFGERWGRHWLDLVRYAESRGHEFDYDIPNAFEYRDYVIRALNADLPYDQFVVEQVAGDLLEQPRPSAMAGFNESIIGTGFWFLGEWCHSPVDIRKDECDRIDNMLDVFSKTFLGVTVACARCHDHKFDAISQADYYALAGYLQSSSYRLTRFETWERDRRIAAQLATLEAKYRPQFLAALGRALRPRVDELTSAIAADLPKLTADLGAMETALHGCRVIIDYANPPENGWMTDGPTFGAAPVRPGQIVLAGDVDAPLEVATYGAARRDPTWGDFGLASISAKEPGRLNSWVRAGRTLKTPTFTLTSGYVHYLIEGAGHVYAAVDSHAMINGPLHAELVRETGGNSDLPTRWITHDLSRYTGERVHLEFTPKEEEDFRVLMVVEGQQRPAAPAKGRNRLLEAVKTTDGSAPAACRKLVAQTLDLLAADRIAADSQPADRAALANWLLAQAKTNDASATELARLSSAFAAAREEIAEQIPAESRVCLAMWDGTPVDENLLIRGNHRTPGPVVPRRSLEALPGSEVGSQRSRTNNRLDLARQLVDARNPLVSRVIVNRVWQHLMGRGIVPSVDNFGVLGEWPTHPELLDYLADEFMRDGWSLKRLIRRIMLSSTYRQRSEIGDQRSEAADPQNFLFHRQNLKRLEGETIRDSILAISGRLDGTLHGPSVPVHLTPFLQGRGRPKESGPLDGAGRRSIYVAVRRNFLSPMMIAFDTPLPFSTIGRRNASNVPAQALILMNDPFVADQAQAWARELLKDKSASPQNRIRQMYLAAFSREPTAEETAAALSFVDSQAHEYGLSAKGTGRDDRAWADLGHVMFNSKEFVFIQ